MATASSKRKRDSQDMPGLRGPPSLQSEGHDFTQADMGSYDDGLGHADNNIDFTAMLHGADGGDGVGVEDHHQHHHHNVENEHVQHDHQAPGPHAEQSASDTAAAAMAQYHHTMTVPQSTEQAFMRDVPDVAVDDRPMDGGHPNAQHTQVFPDYDPSATKEPSTEQHNGEMSPTSAALRTTPGGNKPAVGTDEWHKQRKDNHKEVERRRRETINEGINELSKIVPGCEKNKGEILRRAVNFIVQLKENETQNIEKWTLEKLLTEQAIAELSASCDRLKHDCQRARAECEAWKKAAHKAGVTSVDGFDADEKIGVASE